MYHERGEGGGDIFLPSPRVISPSRINFHQRKMAVGYVIVGLSRFPHGSYSEAPFLSFSLLLSLTQTL